MWLDQNYIVLKFKYDAKIVSVIKNYLPGRQFDSFNKTWRVPIEHAEETIRRLGPLGFEPPMTLIQMMTEWEKDKKTLAGIKQGDHALDAGGLPLYKFQITGVKFLQYANMALLADAPGLGKSIQTIGALRAESRVIIFCPASLKYNWAEEIAKWTKDEVVVISGTPITRRKLWATPAKWYIANYELLLKDFHLIKPLTINHTCVCDEAQRISNPAAKSVKALKLLPFRKRIALTGTPLSNSPIDIWSIVDWLRPGYIGTFQQFKDQHCVLNEWGDVVAYKNLGILAAQLEPMMLRRSKDEVLTDFPPKTVQDVKFDLSEGEIKLYHDIVEQIHDEIADLGFEAKYLGLILVKMLRLQQAVDHPQLVGKIEVSTKFETLKDMVKEILLSGGKIIIFTRFATMAKILHEAFCVLYNNCVLISGDVPADTRVGIVKDFNENPKIQIIVMTEAGSAGLNLQAATYVFHYDLPWSIAKLEQREGRAHRIGQTKPVTVYNLIGKNTMDEYVAKVLHKKNLLSIDVLQDVDRMEAAGLDAEDIRSILRM